MVLNKIWRNLLLATSASTALASPLAAQEQEAASSRGAEGIAEILVTARRTEESLQDTPVAVSAFSQEFLETQNVQDVVKIAEYTPSLIISKQPSSPTSASVMIRGIGQTEPSAVAEPGVGMYLDGVYIARTAGAVLDLVDLERIEVVRGPQGTLFGRNSAGGAIQLVSKRPSDDFSAELKGGYGSFQQWFAKGTVNTGYLGGSPFKAAISYMHREADGWVDNALTPDNIDPYAMNSDAVWITVRGDLSDKLSVDYSFDWNDRFGAPQYFQLVAATPQVQEYFGRSASLGGDGLITSNRRLRRGLQSGYRDYRDGRHRWDIQSKTLGHSLTAQYDALDSLTLKSISAYREFSQDAIHGLSGNGNLLGVVFDPSSPTLTSVQPIITYGGQNAPQDQWQISQELQLLGDVQDWKYVLGFYFFHEKAVEINRQALTMVTAPGGLVHLGFPPAVVDAVTAMNPSLDLIGVNAFPIQAFGGTAESYAIFGQVSWKPAALDERLELTGGLRHTWDGKTIWIEEAPGSTLRGKQNFTNLSWLFSANYEVTDDVMVYGRVSTGYKSGGINPRANPGSNALNSFAPEKVLSYEAGLKAEWFSRRLRTNLALYRTDYDDRQISQFASGTGGATSIILNAGKAVIQGVELETVAVPVKGLTMDGSFGYTDAMYKRFDFRDPVTDLIIDVADEARFSNVPKWNWHIGAQYEFSGLDFGTLTARMDYSHQSRMFFFPLDRVNLFNPQVAAPSQGNLSARLTLSDFKLSVPVKAKISIWGENLANNDDIAYGIDFGGIGFGGAYFREPRSFGIDLTLNY